MILAPLSGFETEYFLRDGKKPRHLFLSYLDTLAAEFGQCNVFYLVWKSLVNDMTYLTFLKSAKITNYRLICSFLKKSNRHFTIFHHLGCKGVDIFKFHLVTQPAVKTDGDIPAV